MKKSFSLLIGVTISAVLVAWFVSRRPQLRSPAVTIVRTPSSEPSKFTRSEPGPTRHQRSQISREDRFQWLEKCGQVPEDADMQDWLLAQKTSWWGKPIDAKEFWKSRVLWVDAATQTAAQRHGRQYPPTPYDDPGLPHYPDDDGINWDSASPEGPVLHFASSSKERAFWDKFGKTHPKPPDKVEEKQYQEALRLVGVRDPGPPYLTPESVRRMAELGANDVSQLHYPEEAFSNEALFWGYVLRSRQTYQRLLSEGTSATAQSWLSDIPVDSKFITQPLTDAQMKAANAWKVRYLQRLRKENIDEQYIRAYLKAWNLTDNGVFNATN